jgi:catechol 2,3-dioxygenase-like lactoylglutathione lyase family enzyme
MSRGQIADRQGSAAVTQSDAYASQIKENAMAVQLNHTIVWSHDKAASARFLTEILGLPEAVPFGPFLVVRTANGVSLDFYQKEGKIARQHYAFLITEAEFDEIFARIRERDLAFWADPGQTRSAEINHHDDGRGLYFEDPDGHLLEIITRPYGSGN